LRRDLTRFLTKTLTTNDLVGFRALESDGTDTSYERPNVQACETSGSRTRSILLAGDLSLRSTGLAGCPKLSTRSFSLERSSKRTRLPLPDKPLLVLTNVGSACAQLH